jgi:tRNA A22 N-methylase
LADQEFPIVAEKLVRERGRFYFIMAAELQRHHGRYVHPSLGFDDLLEAGPLLVRSGDPLVRAFWLRALKYQQRLPLKSRSGLPRRVLDALDDLI